VGELVTSIIVVFQHKLLSTFTC